MEHKRTQGGVSGASKTSESKETERKRSEVVTLSCSSPCIWRPAQIFMTFNIESELIFFPEIMTFPGFAVHFLNSTTEHKAEM